MQMRKERNEQKEATKNGQKGYFVPTKTYSLFNKLTYNTKYGKTLIYIKLPKCVRYTLKAQSKSGDYILCES